MSEGTPVPRLALRWPVEAAKALGVGPAELERSDLARTLRRWKVGQLELVSVAEVEAMLSPAPPAQALIPAQGWYLLAEEMDRDGGSRRRRFPVVAWQVPDEANTSPAAPLVLVDGREGTYVAEATRLGDNIVVKGVHHREDKPEASR